MTQEEVVKILKEYNEWRKGYIDNMKHKSYLIGFAIDEAIKLLQQNDQNLEDKEVSLIVKLLNLDKYMITKDDLNVNGTLDLRETSVKILPNGLNVGWHLNLYNTKIKLLPNNLTVGCDLIMSFTSIKSFPNNLKVNGNLYLINTPVAKWYTKDEIRDMIESKGGYVKGTIYTWRLCEK